MCAGDQNQPHGFDPETAAAGMAHVLSPGRVLVLGPGGEPLAAALRARGIEVCSAACCIVDLIAATELPGSDAVACAERLLVMGAQPALDCLLPLAALGFLPDLSLDLSAIGTPAMLLRKQPTPVSADTLALSIEVLRLRKELAEVRTDLSAATAAASDIARRAQAALDRLDSYAIQQHWRIEDVLQSRIWRTLCAGGGRLLRAAEFGRSAAGSLKRLIDASHRDRVVLHLDQPLLETGAPPVLHVRGWALARSGVERVEVAVDHGTPRPAKTGLQSPEAAAAYPQYPEAASASFALDIECLSPRVMLHRVCVRAVSRRGSVQELHRIVGDRPTDYDGWISEFERGDGAATQLRLRGLGAGPVVSVLMPVFRPSPAFLERAIASVLAQNYGNWELCVVDDCSEQDEIAAILARAASADHRVRVASLPSRGGVSAASNAALGLASGAYIGLLDHDDELSPDALFRVADAIGRNPDADVLYSDEDKIGPDGRRSDPFFKPDWSPDLLLSENYVCHFLVARRELVEEAGGFRSEFDGAQDHDLILRLSERAAKIVHIPRVLYHWRAAEGSCARDALAKPHASSAALRAVEDHLRRSGLDATVVPGLRQGRLRVRYAIPDGSRAGIVIPSGGNTDALRVCLESLFSKTAYPHYEVLIVDNSRARRVERLVRSLNRNGRAVRYLDWRGRPFNFSALTNAGARECASPLLLFLNDDTEVIAPEWLEAMVELGVQPGVGAVGAKLLFPDGRIQHAGVVLRQEHCGHAFRGLDGRASHYFDFSDVIRNVSAVTGACMLVRAATFWEAGGFDEMHFPVSFSDVDLCLRLGRMGLRNLYTPHALLYHHESLSRPRHGSRVEAAVVAGLRAYWKDAIAADPYYSPNLTRTEEDYSLRRRMTIDGI